MTTQPALFTTPGPLFGWDTNPAAAADDAQVHTGQPCTVGQLQSQICKDAFACPHAQRCAAQPVGGDAVCFLDDEAKEFIRARLVGKKTPPETPPAVTSTPTPD